MVENKAAQTTYSPPKLPDDIDSETSNAPEVMNGSQLFKRLSPIPEEPTADDIARMNRFIQLLKTSRKVQATGGEGLLDVTPEINSQLETYYQIFKNGEQAQASVQTSMQGRETSAVSSSESSSLSQEDMSAGDGEYISLMIDRFSELLEPALKELDISPEAQESCYLVSDSFLESLQRYHGVIVTEAGENDFNVHIPQATYGSLRDLYAAYKTPVPQSVEGLFVMLESEQRSADAESDFRDFLNASAVAISGSPGDETILLSPYQLERVITPAYDEFKTMRQEKRLSESF